MLTTIKNWLQARKTGFIPQKTSKKDYLYRVSGSPNKPAVDLRSQFLTPRNQEFTEACTGFAAASMIEYWLNKERQEQPLTVSPLYSWYVGKEYHGYPNDNKGVWLRYTLDGVYKKGFVLENNFPFKPSNYLANPPPTSIITDLSGFFLKHYTEYRLLKPSQVKDCLSQEQPVVCGLRLNTSFYGNNNGVIKALTPNNNFHAMVVVGYDDSKNAFLLRNSWGKDWGANGYCWVPYEYFLSYAIDCWSIVRK